MPNTSKKPCGIKDIDELGAFLLIGHTKGLEMLSDPEKAQALKPYKTIDPLGFSLHQGFMRIPRADQDLMYAPNLEHPIVTVITPFRIYTLRTIDEGGAKITFATAAAAFRQILKDYDTSEEKHWIPLISGQKRDLHIQFRKALEEEDDYCKGFLQSIDDSLLHFTVVNEELCKGELKNINDFVGDIKGRLDVTWRGNLEPID